MALQAAAAPSVAPAPAPPVVVPPAALQDTAVVAPQAAPTGVPTPEPTPLPTPLPTPAPDPAPVTQAAPPAADPNQPPPDQGEVVVVGSTSRIDPVAPINEASFEAAQAVDKAVIGPVALAYRKRIPAPLRDGLRNFLANIREPVVSLNYLLQLKPGRAAETFGRFAINSTAGVAGLFDIAKRKPFRLPRRRNGFANTMGYYGIGPGPYFFLPLIGSTTVRDLIGNVLDQAAVPISPLRLVGASGTATSVSVGVLTALDFRAEFDDELEKIRAAPDPYGASRRFYLSRRQAEIDALRGKKIAPDAPRPVWPPALLDSDPVPGAKTDAPPAGAQPDSLPAGTQPATAPAGTTTDTPATGG